MSIHCQNNNGVCCLQNTNFQKHNREKKRCTTLLQQTRFFLNLVCDSASDTISWNTVCGDVPFQIFFFLTLKDLQFALMSGYSSTYYSFLFAELIEVNDSE